MSFFRGPLANVSRMIQMQSRGKTNRGLFFDSLHSVYTTYCDLFVTNDPHFMKYKNENGTDPNVRKIVSVKDLEFVSS